MILQALYEYYQHQDDASPNGFQPQKIPFLIHLTSVGEFLQFSDTREKQGQRAIAKTFLIPRAAKPTSNIVPNLLWGKPAYVLGVSATQINSNKSTQAHAAFFAKIQDFIEHHPEIASVQAVFNFLRQIPFARLKSDPLWRAVLETTGSILTFQIADQAHIVCNDLPVMQAIQADAKAPSSVSEQLEQCLITGEWTSISRLHPSIKGVIGGNSSGSSLVGCNLETAWSYGKKQGHISPISTEATHVYSTALNLLLQEKSRQKINLAHTTVVFWAKTDNKPARQFQDQFATFFAEEKDASHSGAEEVQKLFQSPRKGRKAVLESTEHFCILGLSKSSGSRLAVKFWHVLSLDQLAHALKQHFDDLTIIQAQHIMPVLSVKRLLQELCLDHNLD